MSDKSGLESSRIELEKRIILAASKIRFDALSKCYPEADVEYFLSLWLELLNYYKQNDDFVISIEVIREYLDWLNRFSTLWQDASVSTPCREQAGEAGSELEWYLDEIIKVVELRLYPQGR